MRSPVLALALAALLTAGCGGDSGGGEPPKKDAVTAPAFLECFDRSGYEAKKPAPREESVLAFQAKQKGYRIEPVNVTGDDKLVPAAFLVFFESGEKAAEAIEELKATSFGGVPIATRGPAVIGYTDEEERALVEPAINGCIE